MYFYSVSSLLREFSPSAIVDVLDVLRGGAPALLRGLGDRVPDARCRRTAEASLRPLGLSLPLRTLREGAQWSLERRHPRRCLPCSSSRRPLTHALRIEDAKGGGVREDAVKRERREIQTARRRGLYRSI